ncbi:MAG: leucine--tRNA ligase [Clostridiales bacterium]|nr:leucine--tRNA ligase [Clostridiales bacterium]
MDYKQIDKKWNAYWEHNHCHAFNEKSGKPKYYTLEMFSYPSGANLHLGHWFNFAPAASFARFKKMQGYEVFQPMGFDAFGLPAENYAIKTGTHPKDNTLKNIKTMERQLRDMGAMYDWSHELYTCSPEYYRWTQWLFLQLYKHGLAYQKKAPVNWCSSCNTAIANEQVNDGCCERCGTQIVRKEMTQWFFKITDYADELLEGLAKIDWPEKTKTMQRNWIGKSVGGEIDFPLIGHDGKITVFTTRADTLFGVSFVVLAPEHKLVDEITTPAQKKAVEEYKAQTAKQSDVERLSTAKEKTGVFTGAYCTNPVNGEKVPVWIADYCLSTYGTGAVMGVAAHDTRDYDFCKKHNLLIREVVRSASGESALPYTEYGVLVNSGKYNGLTSEQAKAAIVADLEKENTGRKKTNYRLRDWSVSRQRYWGAPIPMVHCPHCGAVPVPEKDLPVELPYNVNFTPDGVSPLTRSEEFMNVPCPKCGKPARRDPDTLDTFVCSSWYYLRYPDNQNNKAAFDTKTADKMLPVDKYVGGAEHACMHLLYARFITKALRDMGYLHFDEPFASLVHQGLILGPDGFKMSKNRGNVINPDDFVNEYGSDIFRMYLMFRFAFTEGGAWSDDGIKSIAKFADRIERIVSEVASKAQKSRTTPVSAEDKELAYALNYAIKAVTADFEAFSFNTAIARLMELVNAMYKYNSSSPDYAYLRYVSGELVKLLAPICPHIAEELHETLGGKGSVFALPYPTCEEKYLKKAEVELAVQVNSKMKCRITVPADADEDEVKQAALADEAVQAALDGKTPKKVFVIGGRLINFIV